MGVTPIDLLLNALCIEGTSYILGAGASAPHVPTMAQIPGRVTAFASRLTSFPAGPLPDSPLRRLVAPMIEEAMAATSIEGWRPSAMTSASIAIVLEHLISEASWRRLPQYAVFGLLPRASSIVSFNWDGLAVARCPQSPVLHPHGTLRPRLFTSAVLDDLLDYSQLYDHPDAHDWLLPGLVMPGDEEGPRLADTREEVLRVWLGATQAVIIGYSFGLRSRLDYDRVWLDTFTEAFSVNAGAPVHIVSPDADELRLQLADRIKRSVNVHSWPWSWYDLSRCLLRCARIAGASKVEDLLGQQTTLDRLCRELAHEDPAAT